MVERIRAILEERQLTPTQFADAIGIARPIVSHILSGRNKPSLEVVQKIIAAFPDLALPWLLSGLGPMHPNETHTASAGVQEGRNAPPATPPAKRPRTAALPPPVLFPATAPPEPAAAPIIAPAPAAAEPSPGPIPVPTPAPLPVPSSPVLPAQPAPAAPSEALALATALSSGAKAIRRIVIFYQDGTFADYQPE